MIYLEPFLAAENKLQSSGTFLQLLDYRAAVNKIQVYKFLQLVLCHTGNSNTT